MLDCSKCLIVKHVPRQCNNQEKGRLHFKIHAIFMSFSLRAVFHSISMPELSWIITLNYNLESHELSFK
jgi:hypothetical protein